MEFKQQFLQNYEKKYNKLYKAYKTAIIICSLLFVISVVLAFIYGVNAIWAAIFYIVLVFVVTIITQVGYKKNIHSITNKCENDQDVSYAIEIFSELLQNKTRKDYNLIIDNYFKMLLITCQVDTFVKTFKSNRSTMLKRHIYIKPSLIEHLSNVDSIKEHDEIVEIIEDLKAIRQTSQKNLIKGWIIIFILLACLSVLSNVETFVKTHGDKKTDNMWENEIQENKEENTEENIHEIGNNIMDKESGCMYAYLNKDLGWKLYVVDSASGNRWYALSHTTDGGNTWNKINEDPFNGEGGSVEGLAFWDEKNGFISISGMGQSYSKLLRTMDGGYTFEEVRFPMEECKDVLSVDEYKYYYMPIKSDNVLTVVVKKENVNGGVGLQFQSLDYGASWSYIGEVK